MLVLEIALGIILGLVCYSMLKRTNTGRKFWLNWKEKYGGGLTRDELIERSFSRPTMSRAEMEKWRAARPWLKDKP